MQRFAADGLIHRNLVPILQRILSLEMLNRKVKLMFFRFVRMFYGICITSYVNQTCFITFIA